MPEDRNVLMRLKLLPRLFRTQDAEKVAPHTGIFLSRAAQRGLVHHLTRGNYINSLLYGFPGVEEVACFLKPPAYVSCEWALHYHGVLLQAPQVCTVVTLNTAVGKGRDFVYQGITIEFSQISPRLFDGFTHADSVSLASPEKALLDTLYLHQTIPALDELETGHINLKLLQRLAGSYPSSIQRRLGGLLPHG